MAEKREDASYLDENLSERERQGGHTRLPQPEQEGEGDGKARDEEPMRPDQPDEFGDGDRRS